MSIPVASVLAGGCIPIIRDERVHPAANGAYNFDASSGTNLAVQEALNREPFTVPDGQVLYLWFDVNGYQLQSPFLPVAHAFPHPILAHALEQIEQRQESSKGQVNPSRQ
ncbi:uncharacterized protein LOC125025544 [Penaeus chinensis]|uniref:uncharacterized protein LOC125025544 n=1 Tax=Penaeus chinensis TaxID=139456 RepID=UPI001FB70F2B|nr:uncharacterized protein LOC125025544 [Penaeus chinensis]